MEDIGRQSLVYYDSDSEHILYLAHSLADRLLSVDEFMTLFDMTCESIAKKLDMDAIDYESLSVKYD